VSVPNFIVKITIVLLFTFDITNNIAYHIVEVLIFYADKLTVMYNSKICVYLISRFCSNCENRENLMPAKSTCFAVNSSDKELRCMLFAEQNLMCVWLYISELFLSDDAIEQLHDFEEECLDAYFHEGERKQLCSVEEQVKLASER